MGGCMSSAWSDSVIDNEKLNSALVISVSGDLRQYPLPVTSSQILHMEALSPSAFFICDSDNLFYDDFISAIDFEDELEAGQIYFILPTHKLQYRLSASDMASLAVKASAALNNTAPASSSSTSAASKTASISIDSRNARNQTSNHERRKNKSRISPFMLMEVNQINVVDHHRHSSSSSSSSKEGEYLGKKRISRSGSIRKLQRVSSRRARLSVRSFRLRLSTIYEEGNAL